MQVKIYSWQDDRHLAKSDILSTGFVLMLIPSLGWGLNSSDGVGDSRFRILRDSESIDTGANMA